MRAIWTKGLAAALLAVGVLPGVSAADPADPGDCVAADVAVPVVGGQSSMHGRLCVPHGHTANTVMIMVPGATYNSTYWDFPYHAELYSFRRSMNDKGFATFTVDRLGTGQSGRPLSAQLTSAVQAQAVHVVVQGLRSGAIGGTPFAKAVLLGHSLGSLISIIEAATYHDVDAVAVTGVTHVPNALGLAAFNTTLLPAALDPQLGGNGYDIGYLTTAPGTRYADFHAPASVDAQVVATDEATKDVAAATEAVDGVAISMVTPYSALIDVPVLVAMGQRDPLFCGTLGTNCSTEASLRGAEQSYYSGAPCLDTYVLPGAGHDVNLHPDTDDYQDAVGAWASHVLGGAC